MFSKNTRISHFITLFPVVAELFYAVARADGQTDKHDENLNHITSLQTFLILRILELKFFNKSSASNCMPFTSFSLNILLATTSLDQNFHEG